MQRSVVSSFSKKNQLRSWTPSLGKRTVGPPPGGVDQGELSGVTHADPGGCAQALLAGTPFSATSTAMRKLGTRRRDHRFEYCIVHYSKIRSPMTGWVIRDPMQLILPTERRETSYGVGMSINKRSVWPAA